MSTPLNFKPIAAPMPSDEQLDAFMNRKGVPTLQPAQAPKPEAKTPTLVAVKPQSRAVSRRMALEIPEYVLDQIQDRARAGRCTARHVVMTALREAGITINDDDMISDGRRLR